MTMVPTKWTITLIENIFNQNKKLIARKNNKKGGRRGAKVSDLTSNGGKSYLLVKIEEWIFQTTRMAMYMINMKIIESR